MSTPEHDTPTLDDVIEPAEQAPRDRQEHGKAPRGNDEQLAHRADQEREAAGLQDPPAPPATD